MAQGCGSSRTRPRQPGKQDGAIGRNGILIMQSLLFDFLNYVSGALYPSYAAIAEKSRRQPQQRLSRPEQAPRRRCAELGAPVQGRMDRRALYLEAGEQRLRGAAQLAMERL